MPRTLERRRYHAAHPSTGQVVAGVLDELVVLVDGVLVDDSFFGSDFGVAGLEADDDERESVL
jgi:hypothetical protein